MSSPVPSIPHWPAEQRGHRWSCHRDRLLLPHCGRPCHLRTTALELLTGDCLLGMSMWGCQELHFSRVSDAYMYSQFKKREKNKIKEIAEIDSPAPALLCFTWSMYRLQILCLVPSALRTPLVWSLGKLGSFHSGKNSSSSPFPYDHPPVLGAFQYLAFCVCANKFDIKSAAHFYITLGRVQIMLWPSQ